MNSLRPMFSYFGSKWNLAKHYGAPTRKTVIEPFAGSAAYSLYWGVRKAVLIDSFPEIVGVWQYLIKATEREIRALPVEFDHIDDLKISQEARWLIGYWIKRAGTSAGKSRSAWAREYNHSGDCKVWGYPAKRRIASQVYAIRGWKAVLGDYRSAPDIDATWFIDPPYQVAGVNYVKRDINYTDLAAFCTSRKGQIFVCENDGATWLDFNHLRVARGTIGHKRTGVSKEVVFSYER